MDIDDDDFPVGLAFVEQGHDAEDLDLFDLASVTDLLADFADVERVIIALCLGLWVSGVWVFPGLSVVSGAVDDRVPKNIPGGKRRSSRCNRGEGNSCEQNASGPS